MGMYTDITVAPEFANEPIRPIADSIAVDVRKVVLGNLLYHDTRLSADNTVSCASCQWVGYRRRGHQTIFLKV